VIMKLSKIDHILRAAANVSGQTRFVLVGSAAVVVRRKDAPANMAMTLEIDIYAPDAEDVEVTSEMIDKNIGQGSQFHDEFGYYGDGVSATTAKMPSDWRERAIEYRGFECPGVTAIVPEENDVALAKLSAWREKDKTWLTDGIKYDILSLKSMALRLDSMPEPDTDRGSPTRETLVQRLNELASGNQVDAAIRKSSAGKPRRK
jgi:hypothetical protein